MFEFRIIELTDGNQVIDRQLKTPYNSLTPSQMVEYIEMDNQLAIMDRLEQKARDGVERRRRIANNLLYRLACIFGIS